MEENLDIHFITLTGGQDCVEVVSNMMIDSGICFCQYPDTGKTVVIIVIGKKSEVKQNAVKVATISNILISPKDVYSYSKIDLYRENLFSLLSGKVNVSNQLNIDELKSDLENCRKELAKTKLELEDAKRQIKILSAPSEESDQQMQTYQFWLSKAIYEHEKKMIDIKYPTKEEQRKEACKLFNIPYFPEDDSLLKKETLNAIANGEVSPSTNPTDYVHIDTVIKLIKGLQ